MRAHKKLIGWLAKFLPAQKASGSASVQVGKLEGNITVVHLTQHVTSPGPRRPVTASQRQVLALMRTVQNEEVILDFMQREFGSRRVIDLSEKQLYRVRRYVETVRRNHGQDAVACKDRHPS